MGLKSLDDIENSVEDEILSRHSDRFVEDDEEYALILAARDAVVADMACSILDEDGVRYILRADDTLGVFGVAIHPRIYVAVADYERAFDLLSECGFLDETEPPADGAGDNGDETPR